MLPSCADCTLTLELVWALRLGVLQGGVCKTCTSGEAKGKRGEVRRGEDMGS